MRNIVATALCALVALSCMAPAATARDLEVGGRVAAIGGTPLTNGVFFPGTAIPQEDGSVAAVLPPIEMQQGTDLEFTNLDEGTVANAHKLVSLRKRRGRPLFSSDLLTTPGQSSLVATSNLKPGLYPFYCTVHTAMWGQIEIVQ